MTNPLNNLPYSEAYYVELAKAKELPIWKYKEDIISSVEDNKVIILTAGTGGGKTSQTPRFLVELMDERFKGMMVITQPKKLSATNGAKRLAEELDVQIGQEVGYKVRFEKRISRKTKIFFVTDGTLLQELASDPLLKNYSFVLIDEAHERTINTDISMAMLKQTVEKRDDFRLIVMSATIDTKKFSNYFNKCPIISVPGKPQVIHMNYITVPTSDPLKSSILKAIDMCEGDIPGDIIIFVDGAIAADNGCKLFNQNYPKATALCYSLYSKMSMSQQDRVKNEYNPGKRKVIFSTNLAEASITIATAVFVIDLGTQKESSFNPVLRANILRNTTISQASANQRAGRVGRTSTGHVFRLYTEEQYLNFPQFPIPEINRTNLEDTLIKIKNNQQFQNPDINKDNSKEGNSSDLNFDFIDVPPKIFITSAIETLTITQMIDSRGNMTAFGELVAKFPIEHDIARMMILSHKNSNSKDMISIASVLSVEGIFSIPFDKRDEAKKIHREFFRYKENKFPGDHYGYLNIFNEFKKKSDKSRVEFCHKNYLNIRELNTALLAYEQFNEIMDKLKIKSTTTKPKNPTSVGKSLLNSYFLNIAFKVGNGYVCVKGGNSATMKDSILAITKPDLILYTNLRISEDNNGRTTTSIDGCYEIKLDWLIEISPYMVKKLADVRKKFQ